MCPLEVLSLSRYHLLVWPVVEGEGRAPALTMVFSFKMGPEAVPAGSVHRVALVGLVPHSVICCAIFIL